MIVYLEIFLYLGLSTSLSHRLTPEKFASLGQKIAHVLSARGQGEPHPEALLALWRISKVLQAMGRRCDCYDRAWAWRWHMARRGGEVAVVYGFRRGASGWQGHAWVEGKHGESWFEAEDRAHKEVWRG